MALHTPESLTAETFQSEVLQAEKPAAVCFGSPWSAPCREVLPSLEQLADEFYGKVGVFLLDPDEEPLIAATYSIVSIPTVLVFDGGEPVDRMVGARSYDDIAAMLDRVGGAE